MALAHLLEASGYFLRVLFEGANEDAKGLDEFFALVLKVIGKERTQGGVEGEQSVVEECAGAAGLCGEWGEAFADEGDLFGGHGWVSFFAFATNYTNFTNFVFVALMVNGLVG